MKKEIDFASTMPSMFQYDAKVLRGKNGRFFLDNDINHVIEQFTGELLFSDRQLRDWQLVLENRVAWLDRLGIPYFFLVPPNAHPVYPEDLPDSIRAGPLRPVPQLIQHLEDKKSFPYDVGAPTTRDVAREMKADGVLREEIKLWPRADDR